MNNEHESYLRLKKILADVCQAARRMGGEVVELRMRVAQLEKALLEMVLQKHS